VALNWCLTEGQSLSCTLIFPCHRPGAGTSHVVMDKFYDSSEGSDDVTVCFPGLGFIPALFQLAAGVVETSGRVQRSAFVMKTFRQESSLGASVGEMGRFSERIEKRMRVCVLSGPG
jgi:hypothetical protein